MDNKEKIYVGSGKEMFEGSLVNTTINLTKLTKMAQKHIFEYNGDKYIKLKVARKKEVDEYGKTHYVEVDTWKPTRAATEQDKGMDFGNSDPIREASLDEDLPF